MKNIFALGDLHGHYIELMELYKRMLGEGQLDPVNDTVVFVGDFVDGGPNVKELLTQLIQWEKQYPHWQFLLGNHDEIMIDWIEQTGKYYSSSEWDVWIDQGGRQTIQSYFPNENFEGRSPLRMRDFAQQIPKEHLEWLKRRPLYYETDKYFFVHAGIPHGLHLDNLKKILAAGGDRATVLKQKMLWIRNEFINSPFDWGKKIIFGHTAQNDFLPIVQENKIGLDTMPRDKGCLTAVKLPGEFFYRYPDIV